MVKHCSILSICMSVTKAHHMATHCSHPRSHLGMSNTKAHGMATHQLQLNRITNFIILSLYNYPDNVYMISIELTVQQHVHHMPGHTYVKAYLDTVLYGPVCNGCNSFSFSFTFVINFPAKRLQGSVRCDADQFRLKLEYGERNSVGRYIVGPCIIPQDAYGFLSYLSTFGEGLKPPYQCISRIQYWISIC